jgi:hypothetical protein
MAVSLAAGTGCGTRPAADTPPSGDELARRSAVREQLEKPLPESVPREAAPPVTGEAPAELVLRIREDLAQRTGVDPPVPVLVRAEAVTWPDGSLGCPAPGMEYTQALVPGYWIVFSHDGQEYDYRASARGNFQLCATGGLRPPPRGDYDTR